MNYKERASNMSKCCKAVRRKVHKEFGGDAVGCIETYRNREVQIIKYYARRYNLKWQNVYMILKCKITSRINKFKNKGRVK